VAFGLAAAGIGQDTGGIALRIPAAWNDLVGSKGTTSGLLPLTVASLPLAASSNGRAAVPLGRGIAGFVAGC